MIPLGILASAKESSLYIDEDFSVPGSLTYFTSPVAGQVPVTAGLYPPYKEGGVLMVPSSKNNATFTSPLPLMTAGRRVRVQVDLLYRFRYPSTIVFAVRNTGGRVEVYFSPSTTEHSIMVSGSTIFSDSFPATSIPASWYPYPNITLGADFEVLSGSQMRIDVDLNGDVVLANMVRSLRASPDSGDGIGLGFDNGLSYDEPVYDNFKVWIS